jgi:hypothetical protein
MATGKDGVRFCPRPPASATGEVELREVPVAPDEVTSPEWVRGRSRGSSPGGRAEDHLPPKIQTHAPQTTHRPRMATDRGTWLNMAEHLKISERSAEDRPRRPLTWGFGAKCLVAEGKGFEPLRTGWVPP